MNNKTVLILAAGEQKRWPAHSRSKQLLSAGTEPIIDRIVRQVRERGYDPIIVTHKESLMRPGVSYIVPTERRWKVESIVNVVDPQDAAPVLILLGDVIYQGQVMNRIFDHDGIDMFFGNYAEIFAFYFNKHHQVFDALITALARCKVYADKGTLHSLFRAYIYDFDSPAIERAKDISCHFTHVTGDGGWTRDIDSPQEYDDFINQVVNTGKLDDLP